MKVLLASAEVAPFAKVGGLADVAGSLPIALKQLGIDVRVIMPKYRTAREYTGPMACAVPSVDVAMPTYMTGCAVDMETLPGTDVPVYFIEHNDYFDREYVYGPPGNAYPDNAQRLSFFSRAVLSVLPGLNFSPDIIHLNDWHTALIAAYCRMRELPYATVFTGHNLGGAYQGNFPQHYLDVAGLDLGDPRVSQAVSDGHINLAKVGLLFSDMINTVSERYAEELKDEALSGDIAQLINQRGEDVWGILNGIDYDLWNPGTDTVIASTYTADDIAGKTECKRALQEEFGLPQDPTIPVFGLVTRLDAQKGLDLVAEIVDQSDDFQIALLGTGDSELERAFDHASHRYENISAHLSFSGSLARKVYAGSDMFLMPSRYEPCGLGQMIALAYGTIPVVRRTGGLADTVHQEGPNANGFVFDEYSVAALLNSINQAIAAFHDRKRWSKLIANAFASDCSWDASAKRYVQIYEAALAKHRH